MLVPFAGVSMVYERRCGCVALGGMERNSAFLRFLLLNVSLYLVACCFPLALLTETLPPWAILESP